MFSRYDTMYGTGSAAVTGRSSQPLNSSCTLKAQLPEPTAWGQYSGMPCWPVRRTVRWFADSGTPESRPAAALMPRANQAAGREYMVVGHACFCSANGSNKRRPSCRLCSMANHAEKPIRDTWWDNQGAPTARMTVLFSL